MMSDEQFYHYLTSLGFNQAQIASFNPDLTTLSQIQLAHLQHYPFQSLSTVLSEPIELEPTAVFNKIVTEQQGGYCYELNGLLANVLQHIGFSVNTLTGYIIHDNNPAVPKARTHTLLEVKIDGQAYLVDVGFGGLVPTAPLKMRLNDIQDTPHGRYQLSAFDSPYSLEPMWILSAEVKGNWQMLYAFDRTAQNQADLQLGNWFVSTHPESPFRKRLMTTRVDKQGVRHTLLNGRYRRHTLGQPSISQTINSVDELRTMLHDVFHINTDRLTPKQIDQLETFLKNTA